MFSSIRSCQRLQHGRAFGMGGAFQLSKAFLRRFDCRPGLIAAHVGNRAQDFALAGSTTSTVALPCAMLPVAVDQRLLAEQVGVLQDANLGHPFMVFSSPFQPSADSTARVIVSVLCLPGTVPMPRAVTASIAAITSAAAALRPDAPASSRQTRSRRSDWRCRDGRCRAPSHGPARTSMACCDRD